MVPPSSPPPFPHSYSVGTKTPSPPQPPLSATPSTAILLHHAGADTPTPPPITRDRPLSSTASDRDPCIPSSRFIPVVVHLAGPLLQPSRRREHDISPDPAVCHLKSSSPPPTAIAPVEPSTYQHRPTRHRKRGGTLPYVLKLLISPRK